MVLTPKAKAGPRVSPEPQPQPQQHETSDRPQTTVPLGLPEDLTTVERRWAVFVENYGPYVQEQAKMYMAARARRIWGRLGNLLKRHSWVVRYRQINFIPHYALKWVKGWRPVR